MRLIIFSLLFIVSCGTETGNPVRPSELNSTPTVDEDSKTTVSYSLLAKICSKLKDCYTVSEETCISSSLSSDGFDAAYNLNTSTYSTLLQIVNDEKDGKISIQNETSKNQCEADIDALTCSDNEIQNAYEVSAPSDFSNTDQAVPVGAGSCQDIY